ncbi:SMC-Scp complex subunit ScpB [Granulicella sp. dw_53]|uniref:SMC-Scp complex subunit ScpB n=1 Tax=Granulicella sp. dw_53 TaxID=2719792 RepID=UPI001BD47C06|nr:SMC-Scp complex subunit ScpB [Granulicella sp. dw_53]
MSLKAKIEAVIYASEEPVTLAQLTGLLGHEAQAELDHLDAAQRTLALDEAQQSAEDEAQSSLEADPDGLNAEVLSAEADSEAAPESSSESEEAQPALETAVEVSTESVAQDAGEEERSEVQPIAVSAEPESTKARDDKAEKERARRLREYFRSILDSLIADYANSGRGIEIREVAGGYRLSTKPEYHDAVRGFVKSLKPPLKLSLQALETLAVVAYKQPVTAPEISEIRGVDTGGVLGSLMTRKLITTAGRKQVIGRPILYKTTKDFLLRFGLKDINELPSIEEFEKMAGELADAEPLQEEIPMPDAQHEGHTHHAPESVEALEPERHSHAPQADGSPDASDNPLDDPLDDNPLKDDFSDIRDSPESDDPEDDSSEDDAPNTVSTPEGDNEQPADEPLTRETDGLQRVPAIDTNKV